MRRDRTSGVDARSAVLLGLLAFAAFALMTPPWPGDWDGVGFVLAVDRFDPTAMRPHPPGYAVHVAVAKLFAALGVEAARAPGLSSALGMAMIAGALAWWRGAWAAVALSLAPMVWTLGTDARADALGLGTCALGAALLHAARDARSRNAWLAAGGGAMLGLALGARLGTLPVALAVALWAWSRVGHRRALAAGGAGGLAVWLVPLVAIVGLQPLWETTLAHVAGHFTRFGGSVATDPDLAARALSLADHLLVAGLGITAGAAGLARALAWSVLLACGVGALGRRARLPAMAALGYALWILLAQNVEGSPRHVLPLVLAVVAIAGAGLSSLLRASAHAHATATAASPPAARRAAAALCALALVPLTAHVAAQHRLEPPPGARAARWIAARHPPEDAILFGGRAARHAELTDVASLPRPWMGEVRATLERLDRLPPAIYLTDEVAHRERALGELRAAAEFCRRTPLGSGPKCLHLYRYRLGEP